MKFVDAKCPNCNGSIKLYPDHKSGKCQYCGAELLVQTELTSRIDRAYDLINQGLFLKAAEILNETLLLDSKNGELYFGLLLCDLEAKNPQQLAQAKFDYSSNPNYVKALQFLPSDSKSELLQLCLQNTLYQQQKQTAKQVKNVKSPLVEEFERINVLAGRNEKISLTSAYVMTDFSTFDNKTMLGFYFNTRDAMRRIKELNETLTAQEKSTMYAFDQVSVNKAIEIFLEIEQIIIEEKNKGTFDDILKPEEPTQEDDGYDDDYEEDDYQEELEEAKQKSNEKIIQEKENERIKEIKKRIDELEYEKGGLGIFGGKRKKEIENEIGSLNNENSAILIKRKIREIEAKINSINKDIKSANDKYLPIIETAEQELTKTAFTAFKRRSELKSKIDENKTSLKELLKQLNESLKITNKSLEEEKKKLSKLKY